MKMHRTGNKIHIVTGIIVIYTALRQVEENRTEIFGFEISLVGILCTSPGFHIRSYLLQLSTPQLHYLNTLAGLTRVFSHKKTAHKIQMKMSGLVVIVK